MMTRIRADIFTVCSVRLSGSLRNEIGVTLSIHDQKTLDTPIKQETRRSKLFCTTKNLLFILNYIIIRLHIFMEINIFINSIGEKKST